MRTSLKVASWCGGIAFVAQWIRNMAVPSQGNIDRMSEYEISSWNSVLEPIGFVVGILWIVAVPAFLYGAYRSIIESRQPNVTNIGGHSISAGPGAIVGTDSAEIVTGTKAIHSTVTTNTDLDRALTELTRAVSQSSLPEIEKDRAAGLVDEIQEEQNKDAPEKAKISKLVPELLEIAKNVGPAAKSVTDAIAIIQKVSS
ncbi:hypothetical protein WNY61_07775 [Sulfitobacter sp. AS92]|uniref:hypothetical protein n=1 Tax=Sulfitobacter sp. AS92 TaxID=3135783 RepID=UPI00316F196F